MTLVLLLFLFKILVILVFILLVHIVTAAKTVIVVNLGLTSHFMPIDLFILTWLFIKVVNLNVLWIELLLLLLTDWSEILILRCHFRFRLIVKKLDNFVLTKEKFDYSFSFFLGKFVVILSCACQIWSWIESCDIELGALLSQFILFGFSLLSFLDNFVNDFLQVMLQLSLVGNFSFKLHSTCFVLLFDLVNHFLKLIDNSFKSLDFHIFGFLLVTWLINQTPWMLRWTWRWQVVWRLRFMSSWLASSSLSSILLRTHSSSHQFRLWPNRLFHFVLIFIFEILCKINGLFVLLFLVNHFSKLANFWFIFFILFLLHYQLSN